MKWSRFGWLDGFIFLAVALAAYATWPRLSDIFGKTAEVRVDGVKVARLRLDGAARDFIVEGHLGPVSLRHSEAGIEVIAAPCPNQICKKRGLIHREGESILCLPSHMSVEIPGAGSLDGETY